METYKGNILAIDTGSTTTKIGYFRDGVQVFDEKLVHSPEELGRYANVMDQDKLRRDAVTGFLSTKGIDITEIDIIMARGGLFAPLTPMNIPRGRSMSMFFRLLPQAPRMLSNSPLPLRLTAGTCIVFMPLR